MDLNIKMEPEVNIPMVIAPSQSGQAGTRPLLPLIGAHRTQIVELLNRHGAVLFRHFACEDTEYFSQAIELCQLGTRCSTRDYDIPRTVLSNDIYSSSDFPADLALPLHHEKPRSKKSPNHLYFCCISPATRGGGTLFAHAGSIWQDMPQSIQNKILQHGVMYRQFFHGKTTQCSLLRKILNKMSIRRWSEYFATHEPLKIEAKLRHEELQWEWVNKGNDLIVKNNLPGALTHPVTDQTLWFNSSGYLNYYSNLLYGDLSQLGFYKYLVYRYLILKDMLPMVCHYGNGRPFSAPEIAAINHVLHQHTRVLNWHKGDFLILDNFTFMHGKQIHEGKRLLYSCMTMAPD